MRYTNPRLLYYFTFTIYSVFGVHSCLLGWLRGTAVERWSLTAAGELSLFCAPPIQRMGDHLCG